MEENNNQKKPKEKKETNGILLIGLGLIALVLVITGSSQQISVAIVPDNLTISNLPIDTSGNLEVAIQDQFTEIIDLKLFRATDIMIILDDTIIGSHSINVSTPTTPTIGDVACLKHNTGSAFMQAEILTVAAIGIDEYELGLDTPVDFVFTTGDECDFGTTNWAVDGSIDHQSFTVSPGGLLNTTKWDIVRIILLCEGNAVTGPDDTPDGTSFFTMDAITNGIYLRTVDGTIKNIFNSKSNNDLILRMYDVNVNTVKNRFGLYTVSTRRTFAGQDKNGVTIRLNALGQDSIELVIQDDLTPMNLCEAVVQGHIVE